MDEINPCRTGTASNLLKECVQAKINEIRSMMGGRHPGKSAAPTENGSRKFGDVPVQDPAKKELLGLIEGLYWLLRAVGGMVTRQGVIASRASKGWRSGWATRSRQCPAASMRERSGAAVRGLPNYPECPWRSGFDAMGVYRDLRQLQKCKSGVFQT